VTIQPTMVGCSLHADPQRSSSSLLTHIIHAAAAAAAAARPIQAFRPACSNNRYSSSWNIVQSTLLVTVLFALPFICLSLCVYVC